MTAKYFSVYFSQRDVLQHNHNHKIKTNILLPSIPQVLPLISIVSFVKAKGYWSEWHIACICHVPLVYFNLWWFLSLSLTFLTLTLLKSTGQLFCKMSLNLGLSHISSRLDSGYALLTRISHKWYCVLSIASYQVAHNLSFSTYNGNFDPWLKKRFWDYVISFPCQTWIHCFSTSSYFLADLLLWLLKVVIFLIPSFPHLLIGILWQDIALSPSHFFLYVYQHDLMDSYFIQWIIIHFFSLFILMLKLSHIWLVRAPGFCDFLIYHRYSLSTSLLSSTRYFRFIWYFSYMDLKSVISLRSSSAF